jgi:HEPN domain-containing protein
VFGAHTTKVSVLARNKHVLDERTTVAALARWQLPASDYLSHMTDAKPDRLRQLRPGIRLFGGGTEPPVPVPVRYEPGHLGAERYVGSFLAAAEVLAREAIVRPEVSDRLILPALFSYRHWLELRLKALLIRTQRLGRDLLDPAWTHNLSALWERVQPALELALPDLDESQMTAVRSIVLEFSATDPRSEGFRYAITRRGDVSLPEDLVEVDMAHFTAVMREVSQFLEDASEALIRSLTALDEWEDTVREWDEIDW